MIGKFWNLTLSMQRQLYWTRYFSSVMSIFYFSFLAVQLNLHSSFVVFSLLSCVCVRVHLYIFWLVSFICTQWDLNPRPHHSSNYPGRRYQLSYSSLEFVCVLIHILFLICRLSPIVLGMVPQCFLFLTYFYFHKAVFQGICQYRLLYPYWSSIISHCLLY